MPSRSAAGPSTSARASRSPLVSLNTPSSRDRSPPPPVEARRATPAAEPEAQLSPEEEQRRRLRRHVESRQHQIALQKYCPAAAAAFAPPSSYAARAAPPTSIKLASEVIGRDGDKHYEREVRPELLFHCSPRADTAEQVTKVRAVRVSEPAVKQHIERMLAWRRASVSLRTAISDVHAAHERVVWAPGVNADGVTPLELA